jgi:hypothetical protein
LAVGSYFPTIERISVALFCSVARDAAVGVSLGPDAVGAPLGLRAECVAEGPGWARPDVLIAGLVLLIPGAELLERKALKDVPGLKGFAPLEFIGSPVFMAGLE